jgi:voltage-gated potassium channel Kch
MSKRDTLAVIGALVVDETFRADMALDPDPTLAQVASSLGVDLSEDEKQDVKYLVANAEWVRGLLGPCPWWPCGKYVVSGESRAR